jgi:hypothetical protein
MATRGRRSIHREYGDRLKRYGVAIRAAIR